MSTLDALERCARETREYVGARVTRATSPPSALAFAMAHIAANVPLLTANATTHWRAHDAWRANEGVMEDFGGPDAVVEVNATPNGRGDAVHRVEKDGWARLGTGTRCETTGRGETRDAFDAFVEPAKREMTIKELFESLEDGAGTGTAWYLSGQNDNLRSSEALARAGARNDFDVPFARGAFASVGKAGRDGLGEAVNLWIGNDASQTSYHQDFYENIYTVVRGTKVFSLRPPCDAFDMRATEAVRGVFETDDALSWRIKLRPSVEPRVVWSAVDLDPVTGEPIFGDDDALRYRRPRPEPCFDVEVRAGETLYIPAMWFHRVRQKGITIAVNSWFDMHFGDRYATRPLWEPSRRSMSSSSVTLA